MACFQTQTVVETRDAQTGQRVLFQVACAGAYCAICDECQHRNMVSPNTHQALPCTHCGEQLVMPLGAHFVCPANLQRQFAVMRPFDVEDFLAQVGHELRSTENDTVATDLLIGFMDVEIPDHADSRAALLHSMYNAQKELSGGFWSVLGRAWTGVGNGTRAKRRHLLAVATDKSVAWYTIRATVRGGPLRYKRVLAMQLADSRVSESRRGSAARIGITSWQAAVNMDLGSDTVGRTWLQALSIHSTNPQYLYAEDPLFDEVGDDATAIVSPQQPPLQSVLRRGSHAAAVRLIPI
ncbi:hypothetical protein COEREDRAFT_78863 [Coemansia reversa NRRL 1564]|uniref:Uncharacterized protein n=1 Tax=Coemansia reversa (strain ATCC 12441 / NRRL 1564) TaxID=763665 RepID=A0A2G5BKI5_COERN|nr:hypothetical protein COEREDRAFT_78863 [Coemansia reversa NRRL 1564]|eukprot:PIA19520.1 hypothetical protein COEREDRAFT_78863 [Coemansia reversa NRRL 1564]